ncbi:hypothetical protein CALCODRAFT_370654 [Calocera cornea HHB12733]|uniref:Uncharacterized protein n=1 Tax=Calocera cornea HHB12733 TaxID=1353952 RepID=A0A165EH33_9BASI|nr:hypothetical protein CALCODRAFT_370654 [Calocera cornea HHB12733]
MRRGSDVRWRAGTSSCCRSCAWRALPEVARKVERHAAWEVSYVKSRLYGTGQFGSAQYYRKDSVMGTVCMQYCSHRTAYSCIHFCWREPRSSTSTHIHTVRPQPCAPDSAQSASTSTAAQAQTANGKRQTASGKQQNDVIAPAPHRLPLLPLPSSRARPPRAVH